MLCLNIYNCEIFSLRELSEDFVSIGYNQMPLKAEISLESFCR